MIRNAIFQMEDDLVWFNKIWNLVLRWVPLEQKAFEIHMDRFVCMYCMVVFNKNKNILNDYLTWLWLQCSCGRKLLPNLVSRNVMIKCLDETILRIQIRKHSFEHYILTNDQID